MNCILTNSSGIFIILIRISESILWQVKGLRVRLRLKDLSVAALKGQSPNPPDFIPDFLFYFLILYFQTRGLMAIITWYEALEGNQADLGPINILL
jgi:hypothetical protein